jgi:hypothetical protein
VEATQLPAIIKKIRPLLSQMFMNVVVAFSPGICEEEQKAKHSNNY